MKAELESLKAAYAAWSAKGPGALPVWQRLVADDFRIASVDGSTSPALAFVAERGSRDAALAYLWGIFDLWDMVHYTPETYVTEGDRIAMFGRCAFRNKATGKVAEVRIACLWRFRGGRAVELVEVFDTARAAAAALP